MKRIYLILISFVILTVANFNGFAQEPTLVDEFGRQSTEDLMARLDNLHNQLSKNQGSIALIRAYRGKSERLGYPSRYLAIMKTYLTNHKADEKRIIAQECDGAEDNLFRLYIVPGGGAIPDCQRTQIVPAATTLFDSYFFAYDYPYIDECCEVMGGDVSGSAASIKTLAQTLKASPDSRAYILSYNGTNVYGINNRTIRNLDSRVKATTRAISTRSALIREGIDPTRIVAINGGYRDSLRNVELWFVPKHGSIPKATPNYFPKKRKLKKKSPR